MMSERIFRLLLRAYPAEFRARYGAELMEFFREDRRHPRHGTGPLRAVRFWLATIRDLSRVAAQERLPVATAQSGGSGRVLRALGLDLRMAIRTLRATPAVTFTALLVLTLGIGAGTTIFAVVDAVVLRPLAFAEEHRLVAVSETELKTGSAVPVAYPNFAEWRIRQDVFDAFAASANGPWLRTTGDRPERFRSHRVTPDLFEIIGARPAIGRGFTGDDATDGSAAVVLISDDMWRQRFNRDPGVVGTTITFDEGPHVVVGVMPPGFKYPVGSALASAIDLWVPLVASPGERSRTRGRSYNLRVVGRLAPGVTLADAGRRMAQIRDALAAEHPDWFADRGVVVRPIRDSVVDGGVRSWMLMLLGAVVAVFLIACANVANLLLARAAGRAREIGVRSAMGATRGQIIRALIVESVTLALAGSIGGILLAYWGVDVLRATLPVALPRVWAIAVDLRVVGVAVAVAVAGGVACGLLPALQMSRTDVSSALRSSGRSSTDTGARQRVRAGFLAAEVALATVLLVGAGAFAVSFWRVVSTDLGFDTDRVLHVGVSPAFPDGAAFDPARRRFEMGMEQALERILALPGVESAAVVAGGAPLSGSYASERITVEGRGGAESTEAVIKQVSGAYFQTVGARLLRGRRLSPGDVRGSEPVVVISDEAARRYFPAGDPLGARLTVEGETARTVVGIVKSMRLRGPEVDLRPEVYVPYAQTASHAVSASLLVRTAQDAATLIPSIRTAVWSVLPEVAIPEPRGFDELFAGLIALRKLNMVLLSIFGGLALLIAAIGIYGMLAYLVEQRRKEIGVRMALGAVPSRIMRMVLGRASVTMAAGLAAGCLAALWLERFVAAFLFAAAPHDARIYAAAVVLLLGLGLAAAFVPARRAARVDPLVALRSE